jgi:hypothetical protein
LGAIDRRAFVDMMTVADTAGTIAPQPAHIPGNVGDVRQLRQYRVTGGHTFHAHVPALAMTKVDDLPRQHPVVLPGDARHRAVHRAATIRAMTGHALFEQLRAVARVRFSGQHLCQVLAGRSTPRKQGQPDDAT